MTEKVLQWLQDFAWVVPWIGVGLVALAVLAAIVHVLLQILERRRLQRQEAVFLELTPHAKSNKTPEATQQLFSVLHGLEGTRTITEKLLQRRPTFSLEIVSTKKEGIRYLLRVPKTDVATFEQTIVSYVPDARLRRVEDYMPPEAASKPVRVLRFKQTGHFAYPLHTQLSLAQHDPMAYLTGSMTKLASDELIALQLVATPVKVREADNIAGRMIHNSELVYQLGKRRIPASKLFDVINGILFGILDAVGDVTSPGKSSYHTRSGDVRRKQEVAAKIKPERMLSALEEELATSVNRKLQQPLFSVDIRALVIADDKQERKRRANAIRNALDSFKVPKYQAIRTHRMWRGEGRSLPLFTKRLPSLLRRNTCLLSAAEVADLYHFPNPETAKTENLVRSLSKTLPASLAIKNNQFDVVLGRNVHHGTATDIGLTADERERHMFVVGGTGNGKTTLLKYSIVQDIKNGKGVAVLDPHGDLAQELLEHIPKERINDVIYFNPADLGYPIGMNLLEVPEGLTDDQLLEAKNFIAEMVVSIMRKTFSDDGTGGHRIEYVLRNAVLTALTVKDATIFTVYDLLTDKDFRKPIVKKLEQKWLRNFWDHEFGKAGDFQQVKMMSGVTSKIGRYHASVSAERALEQPKSTINFNDVLDGKILICNLAKGSIGEDTSEVLGISVLAQLQLAAYRRINQKRRDRRPFFAYVDEFQNFATTSFVEMLSEARKYRLFLIMAEQTTSQQDDDKIVNTIITNAGTIVCFKSNSLADERQLLHMFNNKVDPGEIANLPAYSFYAKLSGGLEPQDPVSGMTVVLDEDGDEDVAEAVIAASRKNYAKKFVAKKKEETKKSDDNTNRQDDEKESDEPDDSEELMTDSESQVL